MRILVVVCLLPTIAYADPRPLPINVVTTSKPGDWAIYEGEHVEGGKLVPDHVVVRIEQPPLPFIVRIVWYREEKAGDLRWFQKYNADVSRPVATDSINDWSSDVRKLESAAATCKLDAEFACTKVTYVSGWLEAPKDRTKDTTTTLTMAARVRATGIVELEVKHTTGVKWKLHVVGYGHDGSSDWGVPATKLPFVAPGADPTKYGVILGLESNGEWFGPGGPDPSGADKPPTKPSARAQPPVRKQL